MLLHNGLLHRGVRILNSMVLSLFIALLLIGGTAQAGSLSFKGDTEVDALIETHDYAGAEKLARQKNLDPRIISTVMAFAGKEGESVASFIDYLVRVPENAREDFAIQAVQLASVGSQSIGNALLREITNQGIVSAESIRIKCCWIQSDMNAGDLNSAGKKLRVLLVSPLPLPNDVKFVANTLIARLNMGSELETLGKEEEASKIAQLLYKRFPEDLDLVAQRIASQIENEPRVALLELDKIRHSSPEYYSSNESFLEYFKAKSLTKLGETERAKSIYEKLFRSNPNIKDAVKASLDPILREESRKNAEKKRWQEKLAESNRQQQHNITPPDIVPRSPHRFWTILTVNVIFLAVIAYLIYRRNRRRL